MNKKTGSDAAPMDTAASAVGHLYEAKERLKDAAVAAGQTVKAVASNAVSGAREGYTQNRDAIGSPLADARDAAATAASNVGEAASAEFDVLLDKGKELWATAEDVIRRRPVAAFGTALAAGWLIAKLMRRR